AHSGRQTGFDRAGAEDARRQTRSIRNVGARGRRPLLQQRGRRSEARRRQAVGAGAVRAPVGRFGQGQHGSPVPAARPGGHHDVKVPFDDPGAYTIPWTVSLPMELFPDTELLEAVCRENEKSLAHIPVTTGSSGAAAVKVARALLSKYVGSYEIKEEDEVTSAVVSLSGDTLFLDLDHTGPRKLIPLSDTSFSDSGNVIQFLPDD